jgi:hypothetical protein
MVQVEASPVRVTVCAALMVHIYLRKRELSTLSGALAVTLGIPAILHYALFRISFDVGPPNNSFATNALLYNIVLLTSILAYRLSPFHPLAKYPGPLICKMTRLWACYQAAGRQQRYYYQSLFERYGDVVRTGPNHLIIRDVKAIPIMLSSTSSGGRWIRGPRITLFYCLFKYP